jgi:hypothetical protein
MQIRSYLTWHAVADTPRPDALRFDDQWSDSWQHDVSAQDRELKTVVSSALPIYPPFESRTGKYFMEEIERLSANEVADLIVSKKVSALLATFFCAGPCNRTGALFWSSDFLLRRQCEPDS